MADAEEIRGCFIRTDLYYSIRDHSWLQLNDDGTATIGMTDVAQNLAGPLLHAKVKKIGAVRRKGKPVATVESAKWVGPVKTPISGEIIEVNEKVAHDAKLVNNSPYKNGWLVRLQPSNLEEEMKELVTGQEAVDQYRQKIEADDIKGCEHVEGFEV